MRRVSMFLVLLLLAAACGDDDTTTSPVTETSTSTPSGSTTVVTTSVPAPTTTQDTSVDDIVAATDALLAFVDDEGAVVEQVASGTLAENGRFLDDFGPGGLDEIDLDVRMLIDNDNLIWFVVIGEPDDLANTSFEFDFLAEDGRTVIAEISVVGGGGAPPWVEVAPVGEVIEIGWETAAVSGFMQTTGDEGLAYAAYVLLGGLAEKIEYYQRREAADDVTRGDRVSVWAYRDISQVPASTDAAARWGYVNYKIDIESDPDPSDIAEKAAEYQDVTESLSARTKVAENMSAIPQTRVMFLYGHFAN